MGTEIGVNPHGEFIPYLIVEEITNWFFSLACAVYKKKMLTNFEISILQLSKYRYYIFIKITIY